MYHAQNYDIDVPLFLPLYGNGRLSDIRAIAKSRALGQINFNSGWEWYVRYEGDIPRVAIVES